MNIKEFFELSTGKWFSHRTSKDVSTNESQVGRSDLFVETFANDVPEVIEICQQYSIEASNINFGAKVNWNLTIEKDTKKYTGSTILVFLPNADNPNEGKVLRKMGNTEKTLVTGNYKIGSDEVLTLITEYDDTHSEERLWFASPNLRMRTSVVKRSGNFSTTSFTSEIRMGGAPAKKQADATTNVAS